MIRLYSYLFRHSFINRWSKKYDVRIQLKNDYDDFLKNFERKDRKIVRNICKCIDYISEDKFEKIFNNYFEKVNKYIMSLSDEYIITIAHDFNKNICNSDHFFSKFNKYKNSFNKDYKSVDYNKIKTVLLVDDYSGSGTNVNTTLVFLNGINKNLKVILLPLFITDVAKEYLEMKFKDLTNIHVEISDISIKRKAKFITKQCIITENEKKAFEIFSKDIASVDKGYVYGYKDTEDLIGFAHFTPNNTLGFLWNNVYDYNPILVARDNSFYQQCRKKYSHDLIKILKELIKINPRILKDNNEILNKNLAFFCLCLLIKDKQGVRNLLSMDQNNFSYYLELALNKKIIRINPNTNNYDRGKSFKDYFDIKKFDLMLQTGKLPKSPNYISDSLKELIE